ncbi:MAG: cupin domain-containing protein [Candidatus Methylomirabilia bacterium]
MPVPVLKGFTKLDEVPEEQVTPLSRRKIVSGEKEMVVFWKIKAGAHVAAQKHPNEQIFYLISGGAEFRVDGETQMCGPGDTGVIPGGVEHEVRFREDTEMFEVFAPPREDYYAGQDTSLWTR